MGEIRIFQMRGKTPGGTTGSKSVSDLTKPLRQVVQAHRLTNQLWFYAGQRIGKLQSDITQQFFRRVLAGKQFAEPLHSR